MTQKILPLSWDNTRVCLVVSRGERRADTRENDTTVGYLLEESKFDVA